MNRKAISLLVLLVCVALFGLWVILRDTKQDKGRDEVNAATNRNAPQEVLSIVNTDDGRLKFYSDVYNFSFIVSSEYSYRDEVPTGLEIVSFTLQRPNADTSEQYNRDTPDGFNTAADDRVGILVYGNGQRLDTENIDAFLSWQETASPGGAAATAPAIQNFGSNPALEAITASGIDSFSRTLYFIGKTYIVAISSSDVPKKELYDIADTFRWGIN